MLRQTCISVIALCAFVCGGAPERLLAQSNAISGTVLDQAGKAVPGASVTVKSDTGAASGNATTDTEGKFSVTGLAAGIYSIEATAPGFAVSKRLNVPGGAQDISITLNVDAISQSVTVQETELLAVATAPMGNTLDTMQARTEISSAVIQNFMAPVADFAEVMQQAPNAFSLNPNGIGLGQGKTFFRGFPDGDYTMTFDGIPFEDTNTPTHHSWASFPSQWISSTDFDRSPGMPSDFGPTNFGGSINLKSPELQADPDIRGTVSYGSWDTQLYSLDFESGLFGPHKQDAVLFNINAMTSNGYQTFNDQQRDAGYGKYQHRFSERTTLSLYGGVVDIWNNTPNTTNPTRAQVAAFGDNYLMDNTPICVSVTLNCSSAAVAAGSPDPYYYGYDTYHVQTDFEYAHFNSDLGDGWTVDDKAYTTRYWNKQFYQNGSTVTIAPPVASTPTLYNPSGVDKLNGYRHAGDEIIASKVTRYGVLRFGTWYDWAYTDRYQYPSNILTQLDTPLPNFHEHFDTQSFQPFVEWEWHPVRKFVVTAGIKSADYRMTLNQYQDNQGTKGTKGIVGCLGGTAGLDTTPGGFFETPECMGGAAFTTHSANWNNFLPTLAARYQITNNWSWYAEFAEGSVIPPSAAFDVVGGNPESQLKPQTAKTYQTGSVLKLNRVTVDLDAYYVHFQNGWDSTTDPTTGEPVFTATGPSNTRGIESEVNYAFGHGFSIYGNVSAGSAKYAEDPNFPNGGLWVQDTPTNMEGMSLLYQHRNWDIGFIWKRVGSYWQDNGNINYIINGVKTALPADMAYKIQPWDLENLFFNYTIKNSSHFRGTKVQLAINNLADTHALVGITPANGAVPGNLFTASPNDQLNLMPGRSFSLTVTGGWAPKR